jgi:hypothetical protein
MKSDGPTLNLGHLSVPRESAGQMLLAIQGEKQKQAVAVAYETLLDYFPTMPAHLLHAAAERIVADIEQQV